MFNLIYKEMVDENAFQVGEKCPFLRKNGKNGVVLKKNGKFGCRVGKLVERLAGRW